MAHCLTNLNPPVALEFLDDLAHLHDDTTVAVSCTRLSRDANSPTDRVLLRYAASMIVFVHGVPETAALWDKVRAQFDDETVALSLPGFGCARPDGFSATKDAYAQWLVGELEQFDEPVDLVGHDWGGVAHVSNRLDA